MQGRFILKLFLLITSFFCSSIAIGAANDSAQINASIIEKFQSDIVVNKDSSLTVTETITVATDGKTIQHGIYRDFPTTNTTQDNRSVHVSFDVKNATLDGAPVAFHTQNIANGVRVYLGDSAHYLPADTYVFSLTYTTLGQVRFFRDHDELYWNVTGNAWEYPIKQAEAIVSIPGITPGDITGQTAYTGYTGSRVQDYTSRVGENANIIFKATHALAAQQGLTIVVGWKKGFVTPPAKGISPVIANGNPLTMYITMLIGGLIVLLYYLIVWFKYGRDYKGIVIPQYYPPAGYTPAALRYILEMGYDNKVFAAAILNMAVKGFLTITQVKKFFSTAFVLTKHNNDTSVLSASEKVIAENIFATNNTISLDKHGILVDTVASYKDSLKKEFSKFFITNTKYLIIGILLSVVVACILVALQSSLRINVLSIIIFSVMMTALMGKIKSSNSAWFILVILIVGWIMAKNLGIDLVDFHDDFIFLAGLSAINILFMRLLKRETPAGSKIVADAEGFKLFLAATEKDQLNFRNPPDRTPELFEKYLPYALALDVEQQWCEHFAEQLEKLNYQPVWYAGSSNFSANTFASNLSSSLASATGSASGFSGGGSSGGGGGGGGGGGW